MKELAGLWWFARESWRYLGCNEGSGRWRARRVYARGFLTAYRRWKTAMARDKEARP